MTAPDVPAVPNVPPFAEPAPIPAAGFVTLPDGRVVHDNVARNEANLPAGAIRLADGRIVLPNGEFAEHEAGDPRSPTTDPAGGTVAHPFPASPHRLADDPNTTREFIPRPDGEIIHGTPFGFQASPPSGFVPLSQRFPLTPEGDALFAESLTSGADELERLLILAENETGYAQKQAVTDLRKLLGRFPKRRGT